MFTQFKPRYSATAALMLVALSVPLATPAFAQDERNQDRYREDQGRYHDERRGPPPRHRDRPPERWRQPQRGYYREPPVVYAPPPVYYGTAPGVSLNFAFPLLR